MQRVNYHRPFRALLVVCLIHGLHSWLQKYRPFRALAAYQIITNKSVTYRVVSTARSFMLGRLLGGGEAAASAAYALTVAVTDTALYAATELAFARWRAGRQADAPAP